MTGNINTEHFFRVAVHLLLETIDGIVQLSGKETHEKEIICVDGKESCGSGRRDTGKSEARALRTLNVYAGDYGICIGQKFIGEKTNEIPAAQELLSLMDLRDSIVTADAMNCQKGTVAAIAGAKGDYVLALKGNQPLFYEEVREYFDEERLEGLRQAEGCWYRTTEKEHGGVAVRDYYITEDISWYSEKGQWAKLKSFGMVKKRATAVLNTVKASYKLSMKRIRYELSLDYENEADRLLSMLSVEAIKEALESKGKSPEK